MQVSFRLAVLAPSSGGGHRFLSSRGILGRRHECCMSASLISAYSLPSLSSSSLLVIVTDFATFGFLLLKINLNVKNKKTVLFLFENRCMLFALTSLHREIYTNHICSTVQQKVLHMGKQPHSYLIYRQQVHIPTYFTFLIVLHLIYNCDFTPCSYLLNKCSTINPGIEPKYM